MREKKKAEKKGGSTPGERGGTDAISAEESER
jgi:hypothetical protein